jgi:hypothetical protein
MMGIYEDEISDMCAGGECDLCKPTDGDRHTTYEFHMCNCSCHLPKQANAEKEAGHK